MARDGASAYSPHLRTALLFCGTGTAGAYHAGVLRALHEAGVKVDVLAGHGAGVLPALCGAIDGGPHLWDRSGPWSDARLRHAYRWRPALRAAAIGLLVALLLLLTPLIVLVIAAVLYLAALVASLVSLSDTAAWLIGRYQALLEWLFAPPVLPTIVPRAVLLAVLVVGVVLAVAAVRALRRDRSRRGRRGAFWWHLLGAPLTANDPAPVFLETVWRLVRGASNDPRPAGPELGRRYVDIVADNFGQPGFRELLLGVHDVDARRDLVAAILPPSARGAFESRRLPDSGPREAEAIDLTGRSRHLLVDLVTGAARLPLATSPHSLVFPDDSFWRGETHRITDRPELAVRLVDEIATVGVEQVIIVSPAAPAGEPRSLRPRALDFRARMGEFVRSVETAAVEDAAALARRRLAGVFLIRPDHNPVGPFDFGGVEDESSDRRVCLPDLLDQGYEDAYRWFIEPVVAAGDRVEV